MIHWLKSLYWRWRLRRMVFGPVLEITAIYIDGRQIYP